MAETHPLFPGLLKVKELFRNSKVSVDLFKSVADPEQLYAIRTAEKPKLYANWDRYQAIVRELDHPHLLKIEEIKEDQRQYYVKMKYMTGGTLYKTVIEHFERQLKEETIVKWVRQLLSALEFMHRKGIIHRDVNANNVLLTSPDWDDEMGDTDVVLGDYDISRVEDDNMTMLAGTKNGFRAPEVMQSAGRYGISVDIWSLGCLVFLLFVRKLPFRSDGGEEVKRGISDDQFVDMSPLAVDFVRKCLTLNPAERPTASDLLTHPFLAQKPAAPFLQEILTLKKSILRVLKEHKLQVSLLHSMKAEATCVEAVKISARNSLFRSLSFLEQVAEKYQDCSEAQETVEKLKATLTQEFD